MFASVELRTGPVLRICALAVVTLALTGCSTQKLVEPCSGASTQPCLLILDSGNGQDLDPRARHVPDDQEAWEKRWLATFVGERWADDCVVGSTCSRPGVGLALAGGGSKSAPFAMGVLKRLVNEGSIERIDVLSSVSGGGYAAYYLYDKASGLTEGTAAPLSLKDLPEAFAFGAILGGGNQYLADPSRDAESYEEARCASFDTPSRHQAWVACHQDILSSGPGGATWQLSGFPYGSIAALVGVTFATLPLHHAANSLFDWGLELSPSQYAYTGGLFRTYGFDVPHGPVADWTTSTPVELVSQGVQGGLQFTALREQQRARDKSPKLPAWVIQATIGPRSAWFDFSDKPPNLDEAVFELSATRFGSMRTGYVVGGAPDVVDATMNVRKSVATSAAFFDPMQRVAANRGVATVVLHSANLRWGTRFPNFRPDAASLRLHQALPFPIYLLALASYEDHAQPYWPLADGGMSGDNLGLWSQLVRGARHVIAVDGAYDLDDRAKSSIPELCHLDTHLRLMHGARIEFRGHPEHQSGDEPFSLSSACLDTDRTKLVGLSEDRRLDPFKWERPVWSAVVKRVDGGTLSRLGAMLSKPGEETRIFYIKAATNVAMLKKAVQPYRQHKTKKEKCSGLDAIGDKQFPCGLLYAFDGLHDVEVHGSSMSKAMAVLFGDLAKRKVFPQNSTVLLTADSSAQSYLGYFWLGWHVAKQLCVDDFPTLKASLSCP